MVCDKVQRALDSLRAETAVLVRDADATHGPLDVKSLVFRTSCSQQPCVIVILPVHTRVSHRRLRSAIGCDDVCLAPAETAEDVTGFKVGCIPPLAHPSPLPTFAHEDLLHCEEVFAGAGEAGWRLRIAARELVALTAAVVLPLCEDRLAELDAAAPAAAEEVAREERATPSAAGHAHSSAGQLALAPQLLDLISVMIESDGSVVAHFHGADIMRITPQGALALNTGGVRTEELCGVLNAALRQCGAGVELLSGAGIEVVRHGGVGTGEWRLVGPNVVRLGRSWRPLIDGEELQLSGAASSDAFIRLRALAAPQPGAAGAVAAPSPEVYPEFDERLNPAGASGAFAKALEAGLDVMLPMVEVEYELEAEVLRARRIGKWLLFATVRLQADCPVLQACEAMLGSHVEDVQVVAGRRLFERLGGECMGALLKQVRQGCVLRARGRPHRNPRPLTIDFKVTALEVLKAAPPIPNQAPRVRPSKPPRAGRPETSSVAPFPLQLPLERVRVLEGRAGCDLFQGVVQRLGTSGGAVVGIDAEWQPALKGMPRSSVSILQVATREEVFIVDMLSMDPACIGEALAGGAGSEETAAEDGSLTASLTKLFGDAEVVKLGYGMAQDLQMLGDSHPSLGALRREQRRCVDLATMAGEALLEGGRAWRRGLSALVEELLGQPLDKREQCSAWAQRPLSESQLRYAAQDAHCLLRVYEELLLCRSGCPLPHAGL